MSDALAASDAVQRASPRYTRALQKFLIRDLFESQRFCLFYLVPLLLGCGAGLYFALPSEPFSLAGATGFLIFAALTYAAYGQECYRFLMMIFLALNLCAAGFLAGQVRAYYAATPMISKELGPVSVRGRIESIDVLKTDYEATLILKDLSIEKLTPEQTPRKIRLRLRKDFDLRAGQVVEVLARLMPPSEPLFPGGYDFRRHYFFQGIGAVGFIYNRVSVLDDDPGGDVRLYIEAARESMTEAIYEALPERQAAFVAALTIGKRGGISDEDDQALRDSGLAHLLSISGLHMGLVCGAIFFVSRLIMASFMRFALYHPIKKYAALLGILGGLIYLVMSGASIPTQRSLLMSAAVFAAIIIDRSPISLRMVAFAGAFILLFAPESLVSVSFQMSFAAVAGLIAFYEWLRPYYSQIRRKPGLIRKCILYIGSLIITSLIAGFATAPFSLYHFQQFAALGVLANMVAIPVMGVLIMPMAVMAFILMPFGLSAFPFIMMGIGVDIILETGYQVAAIEGAVLHLPALSFSAFLLMVLGMLIFVALRGYITKAAAILMFLGGCLGAQLSSVPDILISSSHKLVAFKAEDGTVFVNSGRAEKFTSENWMRAWGQEGQKPELWGKAEGQFCDDLGCRFTLNGHKIAYSAKPYALERDCAEADIVISAKPVYQSCAARTIDKFDTWRGGAHAIYLQNQVTVDTAREHLGQRPWSLRP